MDRSGTIFQLNISRGGVPKRPVLEALVGLNGLAGDGHTARGHGGAMQALCLYPIETLLALRTEGHPVSPGATGENITTQGLDWTLIVPGTRLLLGADVLIEITRYAEPCTTIAHCFIDGDFSIMDERRHPGRGRAYARVLRTGLVRQGDRIAALDEGAAERVARTQPRTFRWPRDFA